MLVKQINKTFPRASQAINLFSAKIYKECLNSLDTFYATVADVQQKTGKTLTPQPFLKMVQLAANKILQNEIDQSSIESMKQNFNILRAEDPETLQQQKDKYDLFVEQCKEKEFKDDSMRIMYEVGVDAGNFDTYYLTLRITERSYKDYTCPSTRNPRRLYLA